MRRRDGGISTPEKRERVVRERNARGTCFQRLAVRTRAHGATRHDRESKKTRDACPRPKELRRSRKRREREKEAHLVDDAAGQSVRPPRGNAAPRHPDQRADKLKRREGEYARAESPVHRTVFRRELSPRGREERDRGREGTREKGRVGDERKSERAHRFASRRVASKQPLFRKAALVGDARIPTTKRNARWLG